MKKLKADNYGFTLLEVILSMAILALISIPLMNYFNDSLRHAALMEQKQKATLLAQETIEVMKSQEKLIRPVLVENGGVSSAEYWIPVLAGNNHLDTGLYSQISFPTGQEPSLPFDKDTGRGTIRLMRTDANVDGLRYDVVVDVSTEVSANDRAQAVVHGIDDRKNALIVERDEEQEALAYFLAVNATYKMGAAGGSGIEFAPGTDTDEDEDEDPVDPDTIPLYHTVDELRGNVRREVYIKIGNELAPTYCYTVSAYYRYICTGINNKAEVDITTPEIYNSRIAELESFYLLFNIFDPATDVIYVNTDSSIGSLDRTTYKAPEIVLMCQNMDALAGGAGGIVPPAEGEGGSGNVTFTATEYTPTLILDSDFDSWTEFSPKIRTNIVVQQEDGSIKGAIQKRTDDGSVARYTVSDMTADVQSVRVVSIDISVYKTGEFNPVTGAGDPLVRMQTTKSE